ncbi:pollen receptor-like kinase 4 [Juglans regia]|uniref:Pollen receptor-like kinase 4 n=1 Tax=Juglans regia TaxID=51240 RepID=A0A6P9DWX1_JUGRE|nr:pollen receptor-like kinase 4 [Juglans regia]
MTIRRFAGSIPTSLITLPKLLELRLEDNHFYGQIPDFQQESLNYFNVSGNGLEGPIPNSLSGMDSSSFSVVFILHRVIRKWLLLTNSKEI